MRMLSASLTATSALVALVVSGFVPAPASVSLFGAAAEAKQPRTSQTKGKSNKMRVRFKEKAPAANQGAKSRKQGARKASGQNSKPKAERVAARQPGPSRKRTRPGKDKIGNMGAIPGVAIPVRLPAAAPTTPPRAAQSSRAKPKGAASAEKQAAKSRKKVQRVREGKAAGQRTRRVAGNRPGGSRPRTKSGKGMAATYAGKAATPPSAATAPTTAQSRTARPPRRKAKTNASPAMRAASRAGKQKRIASEASSMMTRTIRPLGGGGPIVQPKQQQAKQGKKSRFYFVPFRGWFGGGKKT